LTASKPALKITLPVAASILLANELLSILSKANDDVINV
jgi:hypothetical protein